MIDPQREQLTEAETEVYLLLRKYQVHRHYLASTADKVTRYAVFTRGAGQITEPATHAIAQEDAARLTAKDIVATLSRTASPLSGAEPAEAHPPECLGGQHQGVK